MDSILENIFLIKPNPSLESSNSYNDDDEDEVENVSTWLKEKNTYIPIVSFSTIPKLPPGFYTLSLNKNNEYICTELDIISDELFILNGTHISDILTEIQQFWDSKEIYEKSKLIHKRGFLLEGYPGTGKSSTITLLGLELIQRNGVVFKISGIRNLIDYTHFMKNYYRKIEPNTPVITILEDLENYLEAPEVILDFMDGKSNINNHVFITTSNDLSEIPDTYIRPSRIDYRIEIPLPDSETRKEYFTNMEVPENDLEYLVTNTENFSLADLKELWISIYILKKEISDSINQLKFPKQKINYLSSNPKENKFGL